MPSIFTENLRVYNAEQFKQSISDVGPTNIYLTFGRTRPWDNESVPPQANSSVEAFNDVWRNMIGAKLVTGNDVRHAIPRHNWTSGTTYAMYDNDEQVGYLFDESTAFFVVTSDWNVYKCLMNNYGAPSTVMPTQTILNSPVKEADGYIWKYMYTVAAEERLRFTTSAYIPVRTLVNNNNSMQWRVQQAARAGTIDVVEVTSGGSGYMNANTIMVTITGDGLGAQAFASINTVSNTVNTITITNPGSNYTYGFIDIVDSGTGVNAVAHPCIPPPGGHGSDPMRELGGSYIIINPRIIRTEDGQLPVTNEFRQIAILQDPKERVAGNVANALVYTQTTQMILSTGSVDYYHDETVYQGSSLAEALFTGIVCAWDAPNNFIQLTNTTGTPAADVLIGANSAAARFVESITEKELRDYSGYLLYTDNISPITRANDQTEDFKIVLKF